MKVWAKPKGFTIVELLIVIVVIGILAAITIVAYNGIQNRAKTSAVQSAASQASKKIESFAVQNSDQYPASLSEVGLVDSDGVTYLYSTNSEATPRHYCITAVNGNLSSYKSNITGTIKSGICPGHWDKSQGISAAPFTGGGSFDATTFRTSGGSMRMPPGGTGILKGGPYTGNIGDKITVGVWVKTDSNWNGTSANSKIRFGNATTDALVNACGYSGVKLNWTFYTCSSTLTSTNPSVVISVANDGSTGSVWLDDLSLATPN